MKKNRVLLFFALIIFFILFYCSVKFEIPFIFCPIYKILHLYCPGCGITRMIVSIIELDFYQAFRYNCFLFIFSPFFFLCLIDEFLILFKRPSFFIKNVPNVVWIILLCFAILFGFLRNIDGFEFLRPVVV